MYNLQTFNSENKSRWVNAMTLGDMFDQRAKSCTGDAVAFPNEHITYPDLIGLSNRFAKALMGIGVKRDDKVGIFMPSGIDNIALLLAIAKVGAVAVPLNTRFKEYELRYCLPKADITVLFTSSDTEEVADYAGVLLTTFPTLVNSGSNSRDTNETGKLTHVVCMSGNTPNGFLSREDFEQAAEHISDLDLFRRRTRISIRDAALFLFTSGTTGLPKAAIISHEALYRVIHSVINEYWKVTGDDSIWTPLPLFHISGILYLYLSFAAGAKYCHSGFFCPEVSLRQLATEECTFAFPCFETIWLDILNHPAFPCTDLSRIKTIFCAGALEQLQRMQKLLPNATLIAGYGSTEVMFLAGNLPADPDEVRLRTCGYPINEMEVRIVEPNSGMLLGTNQLGEFQVRGPIMFDGYYNEPELTSLAFDDGWFRTGDMGLLDNDGRLVFHCRLKDFLKVGGESFSAIEVENYLLRHPSVRMVQVVAAPDGRYVEVPAAYVQLKDGVTATEEELIKFCLGKIATFKVPRYVRFVTEWPMSGTKIQKFALRERIAKELKQAGITEAPKIKSRGGLLG